MKNNKEKLRINKEENQVENKKRANVRKDSVLFENETVWGGKDIQRKSAKFLWYTYNKKLLILGNILWFILFFGNMYDLFKMSEVDTDVRIQSGVLLCVFSAIILFVTFLPAFKKYKNAKKLNFKYKFYNNYMIEENDLLTTKITYSEIKKSVKKICEDNDYVYMVLSRTKLKIIDKKKFTKGTSEEFSKFLVKKFGKKYKKYSK